MDSVETKAALKTSFLPEMMSSCKQTPQSFSEDIIWCGNDDLFVEGLLDFSNNDEQVIHENYQETKGVCCSSVSSLEEQNPYSSSQFVSVPGSELSVPMDDLASLEWVSHFVDDSFSEFSLQHVPRKQEENKQQVIANQSCVSTTIWKPVVTSVPAKARSKRSRTGGRVWSLGSLPISLTESSSSSSSSSYSSPSSSSSNSCLIFSQPGSGQTLDWFNFLGKPPPPVKKVKRKHMTEESLRRCSHCGVQKTPQWRTGPRGPKTLCNACGVRYKSGRLLPEYRPACSPTFSSQVHSNNHRKVLEMRRKKEVSLSDSELTQSY
ncbi:hypothetical protein ACHQM5_024764 [Ranunculus cassubicifolius]